MEADLLVGTLALGKLGFILAFAYLGIRSMEKMRNSDGPKSSLSRDGIAERRARANASAGT
ncbi:MAG: hypothetical protein AAGG56_00960 [Pseudomonadota bacterium]